MFAITLSSCSLESTHVLPVREARSLLLGCGLWGRVAEELLLWVIGENLFVDVHTTVRTHTCTSARSTCYSCARSAGAWEEQVFFKLYFETVFLRLNCFTRQLFIGRVMQIGRSPCACHAVPDSLGQAGLVQCAAWASSRPTVPIIVCGLAVWFFLECLGFCFLHVCPIVRQGKGQGGFLVGCRWVTQDRAHRGGFSCLPTVTPTPSEGDRWSASPPSLPSPNSKGQL